MSYDPRVVKEAIGQELRRASKHIQEAIILNQKVQFTSPILDETVEIVLENVSTMLNNVAARVR